MGVGGDEGGKDLVPSFVLRLTNKPDRTEQTGKEESKIRHKKGRDTHSNTSKCHDNTQPESKIPVL